MTELLSAAKRLRNAACEWVAIQGCCDVEGPSCDNCPSVDRDCCDWWVMYVVPFDEAAKEAAGE